MRTHIVRRVGKSLALRLPIAVAVLMTPASLIAADITGTLNVPKPDRAIVYLEAVAGAFSGSKATVDQRNKVFYPYVQAVVKGTIVEFLNSDDMPHYVLGVGADQFSLGIFTKGVVREHAFNKVGEVALLCPMHPEMEAYVLVVDNPFFAQPDSSGKFRIAQVPPGDYVVVEWYQGKATRQKVKVPDTGTVTVSF